MDLCSDSRSPTLVAQSNGGLLEWMDPNSYSRWPKGMGDYWNGWIFTLINVGPHQCHKGNGDCWSGGILTLIFIGRHSCPKGMGEYWNERPQIPTTQAQARCGREQQPNSSNDPDQIMITTPKHPTSI
jgi:hypothetical protein